MGDPKLLHGTVTSFSIELRKRRRRLPFSKHDDDDDDDVDGWIDGWTYQLPTTIYYTERAN